MKAALSLLCASILAISIVASAGCSAPTKSSGAPSSGPATSIQSSLHEVKVYTSPG